MAPVDKVHAHLRSNPGYATDDVIFHTCARPSRAIIADNCPGVKRDNTLWRAIMSPESEQICYYL